MDGDGGRAIAGPADLDALVYDENGLIPVIAQDRATGAVLMMAWSNRDALERTLASGELHFWSRSRGQLWRKGETSGNVLERTQLIADCDFDTLLAVVSPAGPACHTGSPTCFGSDLVLDRDTVAESALQTLNAVLRDRARERPEGSYTTRLLDDANLRVKKLGEESAELIAALASGSTDRAVEEAADLVYHLAVALIASGRDWTDVEAELARRAASTSE